MLRELAKKTLLLPERDVWRAFGIAQVGRMNAPRRTEE